MLLKVLFFLLYKHSWGSWRVSVMCLFPGMNTGIKSGLSMSFPCATSLCYLSLECKPSLQPEILNILEKVFPQNHCIYLSFYPE